MKGGWEVNLPFLIFKVNMPETKENVVQFTKRKVSEIISWIKDPKTVKAIANAGNILGSGEYPRNGTQSDERYNVAINEQDPEVKARQNGILSGVVTIPTVAIPGSQYVYGGLGTIGMQSAINNYNAAKKEKDEQKQNDAIFNGALAFSTVLPMVNTISTKANLKIAPWVKPIKQKTIFDGMTQEEKMSALEYINNQLKNLASKTEANNQVVKAIEQGRSDAIADAISPVKQETVIKNNNLIDRLYNYVDNYYDKHNLPTFPIKQHFETRSPNQITSTYKMGTLQNEQGTNVQLWNIGDPVPIKNGNGDVVSPWYPASSETIISDQVPLKNIPDVAYHETNHELLQHVLLPWKDPSIKVRSIPEDIMFWKYNGALKEPYKTAGRYLHYTDSKPKSDYLYYLMSNQSGKFEFPVHMRQVGHALGLKQGQPMPKSLFRVKNADGKKVWNNAGIKEINDLLSRYEAMNPRHYYSIIPLLDVENHPDRIWRLLTDTYKLGGKLKYGTNN